MDKHMHYDEADLQGIGDFAKKNGVNFNEDASVFLARELDYVKAKTYEKKVPPMAGLSLVGVSSEVPEWADTVVTKVYDEVGIAKIIANYADDLPRADVAATEITVRVKDLGASYGYNVNELTASQAMGTNLPQRKANAARRAIEIKRNKIALIGDSDYGLYGIMTHPNIGTTTGLNGDWAGAATAEEILEDVDILVSAVQLQSKGIHRANRFAMGVAQLAAMKRKRVTDSGGKSAYTVAKENHPGVEFVEMAELDDLNGAGVSAAIVGEFSEDNAVYEDVMPFNQLPAEARNLELVVNCLARSAGVSVNYPLAYTKASGL